MLAPLTLSDTLAIAVGGCMRIAALLNTAVVCTYVASAAV